MNLIIIVFNCPHECDQHWYFVLLEGRLIIFKKVSDIVIACVRIIVTDVIICGIFRSTVFKLLIMSIRKYPRTSSTVTIDSASWLSWLRTAFRMFPVRLWQTPSWSLVNAPDPEIFVSNVYGLENVGVLCYNIIIINYCIQALFGPQFGSMRANLSTYNRINPCNSTSQAGPLFPDAVRTEREAERGEDRYRRRRSCSRGDYIEKRRGYLV